MKSRLPTLHIRAAITKFARGPQDYVGVSKELSRLRLTWSGKRILKLGADTSEYATKAPAKEFRQGLLCRKVDLVSAERLGFEPMIRFWPYTAFPLHPDVPLDRRQVTSDCFTRENKYQAGGKHAPPTRQLVGDVTVDVTEIDFPPATDSAVHSWDEAIPVSVRPRTGSREAGIRWRASG
jgi:hypothetical protein